MLCGAKASARSGCPVHMKSWYPRKGEICLHSTGHVGFWRTQACEWRAHSTSRCTSSRAVAAMTPSASYGRRSRVFESEYVSRLAACTVYRASRHTASSVALLDAKAESASTHG